MKENFIAMLERCIENESELLVSGETQSTYYVNTVVPDKIRTTDGVYIEAEDMIIDIKGDYEVKYDEYEEMYIIVCNDNTKYYFGEEV